MKPNFLTYLNSYLKHEEVMIIELVIWFFSNIICDSYETRQKLMTETDLVCVLADRLQAYQETSYSLLL